MLNSVEETVNAGFDGGCDEAARRLGDGLQSFHYGIWIKAELHDQPVPTSQVLGLRQRAEDGLEQGNLGAEFAAQEAQTGQLSGKMRRGGVKRRQAFPILRLFDHVLRVTPRPFGVAFPVILRAPILQAKG